MNREEFKRKMNENSNAVSKEEYKAAIVHSVEHESQAVNCIICMEEFAELQQEISKQLRDIGDISGLLEEMADAYICLDLLKEMFEITDDEIHKAVGIKIDRHKRNRNEYYSKRL